MHSARITTGRYRRSVGYLCVACIRKYYYRLCTRRSLANSSISTRDFPTRTVVRICVNECVLPPHSAPDRRRAPSRNRGTSKRTAVQTSMRLSEGASVSSLSNLAPRYLGFTSSAEGKEKSKRTPRSRSHVLICPSRPRLITAPQANNCKAEFRRDRTRRRFIVNYIIITRRPSHTRQLVVIAGRSSRRVFILSSHLFAAESRVLSGLRVSVQFSVVHIVWLGLTDIVAHKGADRSCRVTGITLPKPCHDYEQTTVTLLSRFLPRTRKGRPQDGGDRDRLRNRHLPESTLGRTRVLLSDQVTKLVRRTRLSRVRSETARSRASVVGL